VAVGHRVHQLAHLLDALADRVLLVQARAAHREQVADRVGHELVAHQPEADTVLLIRAAHRVLAVLVDLARVQPVDPVDLAAPTLVVAAFPVWGHAVDQRPVRVVARVVVVPSVVRRADVVATKKNSSRPNSPRISRAMHRHQVARSLLSAA
jgi:hypothetical protein